MYKELKEIDKERDKYPDLVVKQAGSGRDIRFGYFLATDAGYYELNKEDADKINKLTYTGLSEVKKAASDVISNENYNYSHFSGVLDRLIQQINHKSSDWSICDMLGNSNRTEYKENNNMFEDFMSGANSEFSSMFGSLQPGLCKLGMNGELAIKCSHGYKTFNTKTKKLVNVSNFAINADGMFFIMPTNHVELGDVIISNGQPKCVTAVTKDVLTVLNYENGVIENILPERHVFLGNHYMYGKIVCLMSNLFGSKKGANSMLKMMVLSKMFSGKGGSSYGGGGFDNPLMMMALMNNGGENNIFGDMFSGILDDSDEDCEDGDSETTEDTEEDEKPAKKKSKK